MEVFEIYPAHVGGVGMRIEIGRVEKEGTKEK